MRETVGIYFAGDDPDDREFAERIADGIRAFSNVRSLDVDELDRMDLANKPRPLGFRGTGVYIISPAMLAKEHNRSKLCVATVKLDVPGHTGFYICRGISGTEVRDRHPGMKDLFDRVDIGNENDFDNMLRELKAYVRHPERRLQPSLQLVLTSMLCYIIWLLNIPLQPIATLVPIAVIGMYLLLFFGNPTSTSVAYAIVLVSFYGLGWWANRVRPMDLWPFLGRRWRTSVSPIANSTGRLLLSEAPTWGEEVCLALPIEGHSGPDCPMEYLGWAKSWWLQTGRRARWWRMMVVVLAVAPAWAISTSHSVWLAILAVNAFAFGLLFPVVSYWANRSLRKFAYLKIGMTKEEIQRTDKWFDPFKGVDSGLPPTVRAATGINRVRSTFRFYEQTSAPPTVQRLWSCPEPRVFISYAWKSKTDTNTASLLARVIAQSAGPPNVMKEVFLDRQSNPPFSAWRSRLASSLIDCTHLFVILSPAVLHAETMQKEVKTSFQRWATELFPSVICVADDDDVKRLLAIEDLSSEIRFILSWCPCLTHAEAGEARIVSRLITQRARQGLLKDWLAIISPMRCLSNLVAGIYT